MIIKASASLRNDYTTISNMAKETKEPIYITKNGEGDLVLMSIEAFERREQILQLRAKVFQAEQERIEDWYLVQFGVETALKISDHILNVTERLGEFPDSGSLTPDEWLNQQGYRMVICDKHVVIYKQTGTVVYIYHIADTRTDYTKLFRQ
ncbi:prevent-host-death family protein [Eubacterium sp. 14-2]|uniref:type II toxin-antitoxin system prevent-host-death family antitoxin n=1 Tax=Eubacterium sp. 14-2 TaxID=1235790 RepID=UPI0003408E41|nr:type II toxin-antitoxin system prevent-host-death family antitoxin [Eubacterium sp. 14-2]EOT26832.1 prevent-host-death family protein [Eubacterium sp. 14-2]